ncbi:probable leucine-rich repeat receptor-like protein kinase At1g68400 [Cannabis sativa]|uniref:probable leucine-rich repeat receptor-like protein kinase At1g68400 n=1 Tax=Cannabis sativa TaxID=3483 RepID=UPI0029CA160D|nr:probable leucine-rich repeat receptor-like protein kinase At1g68400 [Cannabis sativa]
MKLLVHHLHLHHNDLIILLSILLHLSSSSLAHLSVTINDYYPEERDALIELRDSLISNEDLHTKWTGPPCIQNDTKWVGISCSNGHVVHLSLQGIHLKGTLPPTFLQNLTLLTNLNFHNNSIKGPLPILTNLIHLEIVVLSHNKFSGTIPCEFTELPNLKTLELQHNLLEGGIPPFDQSTLTVFNISHNQLSGLIPNTSVLRRFPKSCFDHNSGLCGKPLKVPCPFLPPPPRHRAPPPPHHSPPTQNNDEKKNILKKWSVPMIAALVPFLVIVGLLFCYYKIVHKRDREKKINNAVSRRAFSSESNSKNKDPEKGVDLEFFDKEMPVFDLDDLLRSSAQVLGKGTLGTTYQTTLETGQRLAVKRLNDANNELGKKEFVQQMQFLGKTRHLNLVQIVSFYYSKDEKLVIYEFVPHGTLFELLHENRGIGRVPLNWTTRLSIIKDIAKGLTFLHQFLLHYKLPHGNLKSTNVLIQHDPQNNLFHSKLTDFGYFSLFGSRKPSSDHQNLAASRAPEYAQGKKLSRKADVYCFGVIILEIITGKIPGEISPFSDDETTTEDLSDWVRAVVNKDWSTDILDVEIISAREGHDEMLKLTEVALECTNEVPENRPTMSEVLLKIEEIEHRE